MKAAVTATGRDLSAEVDPRFGRAAGFVIVDTETGAFEHVDNAQNVEAAQGAGIQAAQTIASKDVDAVLTGHCGPNAFRALAGGGIAVYVGVSGTVGEAIEKLKKGELEVTGAPDVQGHWA